YRRLGELKEQVRLTADPLEIGQERLFDLGGFCISPQKGALGVSVAIEPGILIIENVQLRVDDGDAESRGSRFRITGQPHALRTSNEGRESITRELRKSPFLLMPCGAESSFPTRVDCLRQPREQIGSLRTPCLVASSLLYSWVLGGIGGNWEQR